jgi:hypothetical protein
MLKAPAHLRCVMAHTSLLLGCAEQRHPSFMGKGRRPFHNINVWGGRLNDLEKTIMFK